LSSSTLTRPAQADKIDVQKQEQEEEMSENYKKQDRELIDLKQTYEQDAI
jgi:hypothetical protein